MYEEGLFKSYESGRLSAHRTNDRWFFVDTQLTPVRAQHHSRENTITTFLGLKENQNNLFVLFRQKPWYLFSNRFDTETEANYRLKFFLFPKNLFWKVVVHHMVKKEISERPSVFERSNLT